MICVHWISCWYTIHSLTLCVFFVHLTEVGWPDVFLKEWMSYFWVHHLRPPDFFSLCLPRGGHRLFNLFSLSFFKIFVNWFSQNGIRDVTFLWILISTFNLKLDFKNFSAKLRLLMKSSILPGVPSNILFDFKRLEIILVKYVIHFCSYFLAENFRWRRIYD